MFDYRARNACADRLIKIFQDSRYYSMGDIYHLWVRRLLKAVAHQDPGLLIKDVECEKTKRALIEATNIYTPFAQDNACVDVLGMVMTEMGKARKELGAFYTPQEVSKFIAQINLVDTDIINHEGPFRFYEPCVGAGSMVLSFIYQVFLEWGVEGIRKLSITINDLDVVSLDTATLQILHGLSALDPLAMPAEIVCLHGNSLTNDTSVRFRFEPNPGVYNSASKDTDAA